jgi:hypothetical protein
MSSPSALPVLGKPSRAKHNSNHRRQRRKSAKKSIDSNVNIPSTEYLPATANNVSIVERSKRCPERPIRPVAASSGVEGIAKKKTTRGRPNRPWKPWAKLSLTEIENIAERRGNGGRGFEQ